jgi:hypothetical protein
MAPSLATGRGALQQGPGVSQQHWVRIRAVPDAVLELRYETATTLLLRGVLQRGNPRHRAILQMFPGGWVGGWVGG